MSPTCIGSELSRFAVSDSESSGYTDNDSCTHRQGVNGFHCIFLDLVTTRVCMSVGIVSIKSYESEHSKTGRF